MYATSIEEEIFNSEYGINLYLEEIQKTMNETKYNTNDKTNAIRLNNIMELLSKAHDITERLT